MTTTVRLHRVFRTTAERLYRAFVDPDAMVKWLPPDGFTAKVFAFDARIGGRYSMSFTNFVTGETEAFAGEYLELLPYERLRYTAEFENAALPGVLVTTVEFRATTCGTEVNIVQEGIPDLIPVEGCYLGWQESLFLLQHLVEANVGH